MARASSMKDGPKSPRASHSRIASSTSQSFAFSRLGSALSLSGITRSTSPRWTARKAASWCLTVSTWVWFLGALGLYFEDGDLGHQLADRDRHQDVLWRNVSGAHAAPSAFAVAPVARGASHADEGACSGDVLRCRTVGER